MGKYFEQKSYDEGQSSTDEVGHRDEYSGYRKYEFTCKSLYSITGLYHYETSEEYGDNATQVVYFRVKDLKQLPSFPDRVADKKFLDTWWSVPLDLDESCKKAILELAEAITGWYGFDTGSGHDCSGKWFAGEPIAEYVGKSKNWVRVRQYSARDV